MSEVCLASPVSRTLCLLAGALGFGFASSAGATDLRVAHVRTLHAPEMETRRLVFSAFFSDSEIGGVVLQAAMLSSPGGRSLQMNRTSSSRSQTFRGELELGPEEPWPAGAWNLVFTSGDEEWESYNFVLVAPAPVAFSGYPPVPVAGYGGDPWKVSLPSQPGTSRIILGPGVSRDAATGAYVFTEGPDPGFLDRAALNEATRGLVAGSIGTGPALVFRRTFESEIRFVYRAGASGPPHIEMARAAGGPHLEFRASGLVAGKSYRLFTGSDPAAMDGGVVFEPWSDGLRLPQVPTGSACYFRLVELP